MQFYSNFRQATPIVLPPNAGRVTFQASIDDSVVEFSPATREARVRFPVDAVLLQLSASDPIRFLAECGSIHFLGEHRWFSGRILACHAGGPGSIPGRCSFRPISLILDAPFQPTMYRRWRLPPFIRFPVDAVLVQVSASDSISIATECGSIHLLSEHRWFSGRILACHAGGPRPIPGRCSFTSIFGKRLHRFAA